MAFDDDISSEHFDWLVEGRSRNQRTTLDLYKIIEAYEAALSQNIIYQNLAQNLVAVAFSLWRAVFSSDLSGHSGDRLADVKKFLQSLIAHNAILYQTDFSTREWTFEYYLDNALFRLDRMEDEQQADNKTLLLSTNAKDSWINAQKRLDLAVAEFEKVLSGHGL